MKLTYENLEEWFDIYFEDVNKNQGQIEDVAKSRKYFTADFEFMMYTPPPFVKPPLSREDLLMLFVHPGLHEALKPRHYVIDLKRMIVVVQFELQFSDKVSGKTWQAKQASAHYHLVLDENQDLKIKKIQYWTGSNPSEDYTPMYQLWSASKEKALSELAIKHINEKQ